MGLKELRSMSKTEFAMWVARIKVKELKQVLKAEGIKISKLRKAEALEELMKLIREVDFKAIANDLNKEKSIDRIDSLVEKVETLKTDIEIRTAQEENYEGLIVGMLKKELISLDEFKLLIQNYDLDLMYSDKLELTLDYYSWSSNCYSEVDRYSTGYLGTEEFKFSELGKCYDPKDMAVVDWCKTSFIKDGNITISIMHDEYDQRLCFFKDKELIANFDMNSNLRVDGLDYYDDVKALEEYLDIKLMATYIKLQKKMLKYYEREDFREECRKNSKRVYKEKKSTWDSLYGYYNKTIRFEDIWDENCKYKDGGKEKEQQAKRVREEYWEKNNKYNSSDYSKLFSNTPTIKTEDKPLYKNIYKALMMKFHPDKMGDEGTKYSQIINELKVEWGI